MKLYTNKVAEDVEVSAEAGFGTTVALAISPGSLSICLQLEADQARDIGLALMDAANAADRHDAKRKHYRDNRMIGVVTVGDDLLP